MKRIFFPLAFFMIAAFGIANVNATAQQTKKAAKSSSTKAKGKTKAAEPAAAVKAERVPDPELALIDSLQKSDKRYESLEDALKEPEAVRLLDLHEKNLTELPKEIGKLVNVHTISLYGNQIKSIPAELANLKKLRSIDFGKNQLTEVPPAILKLKDLKVLYLTSNQIEKLPKELCTNLTKLAVLDLGGNQISALPPEIAKMQNVRLLNLRFNRLETLPATMTKMKNLEMIMLNSNPISEQELRKIDKMLQSTDIRFTY